MYFIQVGVTREKISQWVGIFGFMVVLRVLASVKATYFESHNIPLLSSGPIVF